jgi:BASS family bile acid:Na+ symporter
MKTIARFLKNYSLPVAMVTGAANYQWIGMLGFLTPYLIFIMLLLTFCKLERSEVKLHQAHVWLLLVQLVGAAAVYLAIRDADEVVAQGAMLCVIAPTATAAAVVTGMLGGNVGFLTAYLLFCNIALAIAAPFAFSVVGTHGNMPFLLAAWMICKKTFPLLILPLVVAQGLKKWMPLCVGKITQVPQLTFYLWSVALVIVTGITVKNITDVQHKDLLTLAHLAAVSLVICGAQFLIGRKIGKHYGDATSAGQGLGQKNTILALWMAQTFLHPLAGFAPACYILWQNIVNSYQIWRKRK